MTPIYLEEDPTGQAVSNKQSDEEHVLTANRPVRAIVLDYGAYFTGSLIVKNKDTGVTLTRGVHYKLMDLNKKLSMRHGSEICESISIEDATLNTVLVTYQAFGGSWGTSNRALYANIGEIELDDKPVEFSEIIGKPERYTPLHHYTDAGDLYGLEYIVRGLEEVKDAILLGDKASHDEIYRDIEYFRNLTQEKITDLRQRISNHIADFNNPHNTTALQAGTYTKVETNSLLASADAALTVLANALEARMTSHFTNYTNAHGTTPAMLGGLTMAEYDAMLVAFQQSVASSADGYWEVIYSGNGATTYSIDYQQDNDGNGVAVYNFSSPYGTIEDIPIAYVVGNSTAYAQYFAVSCLGDGTNALMNYLWVNGLRITNSLFGQYGDPKDQLTIAYLPSGSTLYVANAGPTDAGAVTPANIYVSRWTRR